MLVSCCSFSRFSLLPLSLSFAGVDSRFRAPASCCWWFAGDFGSKSQTTSERALSVRTCAVHLAVASESPLKLPISFADALSSRGLPPAASAPFLHVAVAARRRARLEASEPTPANECARPGARPTGRRRPPHGVGWQPVQRHQRWERVELEPVAVRRAGRANGHHTSDADFDCTRRGTSE